MLLSPWNLVICSLTPDKTTQQCLEVSKIFQWKVTPWQTTLKIIVISECTRAEYSCNISGRKEEKTTDPKPRKPPTRRNINHFLSSKRGYYWPIYIFTVPTCSQNGSFYFSFLYWFLIRKKYYFGKKKFLKLFLRRITIFWFLNSLQTFNI